MGRHSGQALLKLQLIPQHQIPVRHANRRADYRGALPAGRSRAEADDEAVLDTRYVGRHRQR